MGVCAEPGGYCPGKASGGNKKLLDLTREYMDGSGEAETEILDGNAEIWLLLRLMGNQWLCSPSGIYGINFLPIMEAAHHLRINIDRFFLEKVKTFEDAALKMVQGRDESCNGQKKKACEAQFGLEYMDWACKNCKERET
jgi:hypothetical protein